MCKPFCFNIGSGSRFALQFKKKKKKEIKIEGKRTKKISESAHCDTQRYQSLVCADMHAGSIRNKTASSPPMLTPDG